ncbi:MAG: dicarboxylate/amino acid:cation symporter [Jaaginema sp. PMC 1079.18]|nr:dicarboxylate/amino acid:cation symporter [Jaaginema sp. PMC 1080.18]MEC4850986.1 dicarboxylate/amino acid:cation symporter [Jaaginema sp. PMC 1079.18]MEC4865117.1 dicarboxylate/amino acid:cation symporter [Jaaginema sp. PMC 1078.18]
MIRKFAPSRNWKRIYQTTLAVLQSPWTILVSVVLGVAIGLWNKNLASAIAPLGNLYLILLKMCVLPILLSAITMSIGRLMTSHDAKRYIKRILIVFPVGWLGVSLLGTIVAAIAGPGRNLPTSVLETLGVLVNESAIDLELSLEGPLPQEEPLPGLGDFLYNMVPDNIFEALSQGDSLQVLFFAIVFGTALGLVGGTVAETLFATLEAIYRSFNKLIQWFTLILPLGLCSLLAAQIADLGIDIMLAMIDFVIIVILTFGVLYLIGTLIIWRYARCSLTRVFAVLREPTILALATRSSLACIPSAISAMHDALRFDRKTTDLVVPLAVTLCRFGSVVYFALAALFVAQLYDNTLGLGGYAIAIFASILAGMATSGVTGVLTLTLLQLVLDPLGLPLEAALVLFIAIDPIVDPFRTLGIVHTSLAATAAIADLEPAPDNFATPPVSLKV